jgi:hypothetical protein
MHVIRHEDVSVYLALFVYGCTAQCVKILRVVFCLEEDRLPVDAACNDVLGKVRN